MVARLDHVRFVVVLVVATLLLAMNRWRSPPSSWLHRLSVAAHPKEYLTHVTQSR